MSAFAIPEFEAMGAVAEILSKLDADERRRVVEWAIDYFGVYEEEAVDIAPVTVAVAEAAGPMVYVEDGAEDDAPAPDTFSAFYAKVAPKTAIQKAITAAYWLEEHGADSWRTFELNKLLKEIDPDMNSVVNALALEAKSDTPRIAILERSGDSMQARKTFRLTDSGAQFVENRIN